MDSSLKDQAESKIVGAESVVVAVSKNSSLDGLASGLSIYLSLKKLNKNVKIIAKAPTVNDARLLYGVGDIGRKENSKNLVIGVKNAVKNVDKVTYFLDQDILKIIVHALPDSTGVTEGDVVFESASTPADLLISVGYNSIEELNTDIAHEQEINPNMYIINVNREKPMKKFAQIEVVDPSSPSLSETIAGFSQVLALPIDEDIAFNLYTGIASATQMFSPKLARPETLSTAAWLLKFGAGKSGLAQDSSSKIIQPNDNLSQNQGNPISPIQPTDQMQMSTKPDEQDTTPIEQVEREGTADSDWLKPPKMYRGSKSFDIES